MIKFTEKISKIERLVNNVDKWIQDGKFESKVKKADDKERVSYLIAVNYLISKNREKVFRELFGIENLSYYNSELTVLRDKGEITEKNIIDANIIADNINNDEGYLEAREYFF